MLSQRMTLIIYIWTVFPEQIDKPVSVFLDLVELEETTAASIATALLNNLHSHGISQEQFLCNHFLGFASDGASVMLGRKAGVAKLLMDQFPRLIVWHFAARRLESVCMIRCLEYQERIISDLLSTNCNVSVISLQRIGMICKQLLVTWVSNCYQSVVCLASSVRTLTAVWQLYPALYSHFMSASQDGTRDSKERSCHHGLVSKLTSNEFLLNIATKRCWMHYKNSLSCRFNCRSGICCCMMHIRQAN